MWLFVILSNGPRDSSRAFSYEREWTRAVHFLILDCFPCRHRAAQISQRAADGFE